MLMGEETSDVSYSKSLKTENDTAHSEMCKYLHDHILEELDGAKDYMSKAVKLKSSHPSMARKFYRMSEMEAEHANALANMFTSISADDICHAEMYKDIMEGYNVNMTEVSNLKKLYHSEA